jgi:hypothetical protein
MADLVADPVDISGMPDPGTIGLSPSAQADPTVGMPDPETLYRKYHFGGGLLNASGKPGPMEDIPKDVLAEFMANPPDKDTASRNLKTGASALTGLPRVAAVYNPITPTVAAVAGGAGALTGALGAALDPEHAAEHLETGHQRLRDWSSSVYNLANKIPATEAGAKLADYANALPAEIGKSVNDTMVRPWAGDNAADTLGDVAQDVGTLLPGAHAPALARGGAGAVAKAARATKDFVKREAASVIAPEPAADYTTPPVGKPLTGDDLRAAVNPIPPPEGTVAAERQKAAAANQPLVDSQPAAEATPAAPALPETDSAPQDMNLSPEQRALVREGVAARRAAAESQRGSVRLFNAPKDEGPKETATPEQQSERQGHLDALDRLSSGQLPARRTSALTGDYNATGNDWQAAKIGNEAAQRQLASESDALHAATTNVHNSIGSLSDDSVDPTTLGDRGRTTRGAVQAIEKHFNDATDALYNKARELNQGKQIPALARVKAYLDDDSNFTNDAEIGLQRAAKQRLERLWTTGDPDKGTPPGSVNAAERFREFLNEKGRNPQAMGVAGDLKGHVDMDVAEHGGPGLFEQARAMRRHQFQMLEEPVGIKKLLTPGDSSGINHAIPEHKVMDYIADLPREQHERVMDVLRAGAHMSPELAESSAAAIKEIQAHTISRLHDAATNDGGKWNARDFYNATSRYARNAASTFKDRPDVLKNLKTISDAGNTLHMDKSYPGAVGQAARSGILTGAVKGAGAVASSLAHEIPVVGRILGRGIEGATEAATGDIGKRAAEKAFEKRTVDRTGKQRGAVGDLRPANSKISKEDFETLYKGVNIPENATMRDRWDALWRAQSEGKIPQGFVNKLYNSGMNDDHIDTALRAVGKGTVGGVTSNSLAPSSASSHGSIIHDWGKQRGSVQIFNDNPLNRKNEERTSFHGKDINPRNERNERTANQQMGGRRPLTDEQNDVIGRLMGGKQRGAVGDLRQRERIEHSESQDADGTIVHNYKSPGNSAMMPGKGGSLIAKEYPERGVTQVSLAHVEKKGQGWGTQMLAKAADDAHARGQVLHSDQQVSGGDGATGQAGAYSNLKKLGYNVKVMEHDTRGGAMHAVGDHVFEVRPGKGYQAPKELEDFIKKSAPAHRVDENGPANWEDLKARRNEKVMPINPQGSEGSIYSNTPTNIAFRAWHDKTHLDVNGGFDHDGEYRTAVEQLRQAKAAGLSEEAQRALWADTWETFKHHEDNGDFPKDPRQFVAQRMRDRSPIGGKQRGSVRVMNDEESAPRTAEEGSQLNVGLHQGQEGDKNFRKMSKQEAQAAVESETDAKVTKNSVLTPKQHGVGEPTAVMSLDRPLSDYDMQRVLAKTKQSAIPQRTGQGDTSMHVAPGHEDTAKKEGWDTFNPDYFREHSGRTMSETEASPDEPSRYPPHPDATVKGAKQSKFPGIYDDPKQIMERLGPGAPESPHLKSIFGVTREDLHDAAVARGDVEPKTPIPGIAPKGRGSAHAQSVMTPENAERIRSTIQAYKEHDPGGYHGMVGWYEMDPMFQSIKKILGGDKDRAGDVYHKLNSYTSYASPMSSVEPEIRRGTAAATMAAEGNFDKFAKSGGLPNEKAPRALKSANFELGNEGHPMHSTAHAGAMSRFNESGQEANAVKTGTYRRSSDAPSRPGSEYQNTVPVGDSHWSRGAGLADVRGEKAFEGSAEGPEMKVLAPWYRDEIARHPDVNLPSTSAQAVQWGALSKETGVDSPIGAPKLEIWADQIAAAAKRADVSPKEMWQRIVKRLAK